MSRALVSREEAEDLDRFMADHMYGHSISNSYASFACDVRCRTEALREGVGRMLQARRDRWVDPPSGWYAFGTHSGWDEIPPLEFSEEKDEGGDPLFERPVG